MLGYTFEYSTKLLPDGTPNDNSFVPFALDTRADRAVWSCPAGQPEATAQ